MTRRLTSRAQAERAIRFTPGRRRALEWLADHPHSTLRECAAAMRITPAAVHYARVSLVKLDLIERTSDIRSARLTLAGFAVLGRRPVCPTCNQPITRTGDA